jgi:hypothetical protein
LNWPVKDVGKKGQVTEVASRFSNLPELHRRVLENWEEDQAVSIERLRKLFHFSSRNYGGY